MSTDPVDEADEETFPASDAPTLSGAHASAPPPYADLGVLVDVPPGSPPLHGAAVLNVNYIHPEASITSPHSPLG